MRRIILLVVVFLTFFTANATHMMGGEITWECIKSGPTQGMYIFTMKVYRDCNGVNLNNTPVQLTVHNHPSINSIQLDY